MRARLLALLVAALVLTGSAVVINPTAASAGTIPAPTGLTADFGTDPNHTPRNPTLRWDKVAGATTYHVQIATDGSFTSVVWDTTTYGHQVTPPNALPIGTLYWRVAATISSSSGPFAQQNFAESWDSAPQLQSPANRPPAAPSPAALTYPSDPAVFSWTALDGATSYTLQIDDAPDFIGAQSYSTPNTSYTLTEPQTVGQQFYWRVQASSGSGGVVSPWSDTWSYTYQWQSIPVMDTPTDGQSVTDVVFHWAPVPGAKNYELQVSPNGQWTNNSTIDKTLVATTYTPATPLDNGSYFWRVRSIDAAGHFGPWANPFSFTRQWVDRVVLQVPAYSSSTPNDIPNIGTDVRFQWSAVRHASEYEVQFSVDQNFSQTISCYTNHTEWTPYARLYPTSGANEPNSCLSPPNPNVPTWSSGIPYYWRVRGLDGSILGLWSDPGEFIRNPPAPVLSAPDDGATTVDVPTMSWSAVPGAEKYKVTLTSKSGSPVTGFPVTTYATSVTPLYGLSATQSPYTWTVQAIDATGFGSVVPPSRQFTMSSAAPTSTEPPLTLDAPADGAQSRLMPNFSWAPIANAYHYTVHVSLNGFEQTPLTTTDPYPAFTPSSVPATPGVYTWWVDARDSSNTLLGTSGTSTFEVLPLDSLVKTDYLTPARCDLQSSCPVVNDTPTFSWNPIPNAALYRVTIAADSHFTTKVREYTTAYTTLTPRESLLDSQAGQAYYWFVRPCIDAAMTRCGPGSDNGSVNGNAGAFQKRSAPVMPVSPDSPSQVPDQITFRWQDYLDSETGTGASQEAAAYHLQVATAADFTQTSIIDDQTVDATSYTPSGVTYPEGPLYWRVQAIDNSGNALTWSAPKGTTTGWLVTKASPLPRQDSPAAGADETGVPYLEWDPQDYAASYTVEVYKNADVNASPNDLVTSATTKFAAWSPTAGLPQGDYVWRVRRTDGGNKPGPWSVMRSFHLEQAAPTLTSPAPGAEINSSDVLFTWTPVAGASQYRWQLSQNPGFSGALAVTTLTSSWSPTTAINDGTYYWRVQVLDGSKVPNVLATSATRSFTKDGTPPVVRTVSPTSLVPITPTLTATFSEPVQNVTAATFQVAVAATSSAIAGRVHLGDVNGVQTATWESLKPLMPGQTYTATLTSGITDDPAGNPLTSKSWTFRTNTVVENDSPALVEHWDRDAAKSALGGSYDASKNAGASASYTFRGTGVSVLGTRMKTGGYAAVYLDGVKQTSTASFYNGSTQYRKVIWSKSGLTNGWHTIQVRVLGTKPAAASDRWVYLDGFQVGTAQVDQVNSTVTETFARVRASTASGGTYDTVTHATSGDTAGRPSFSAQFRGTGVSVYGVKSTSAGKAAIYVDGKLRSTVDLRSTSTYSTTIAGFSGLTDAVHTLRIDAVGTTTGAGSDVGIDYLRVS